MITVLNGEFRVRARSEMDAHGPGIQGQVRLLRAQSKSMTKAMQHACIAIQSAHHHYRQAMDLVDAVCSPRKNRWEAMMGDEQSRQETYRGESLC